MMFTWTRMSELKERKVGWIFVLILRAPIYQLKHTSFLSCLIYLKIRMQSILGWQDKIANSC